MVRPKFTHLVMSSGGLLGMTYLGALKYIYQEKMDKDIIHVCGASAGALYGAGFVLGIPIDVMEETMKKVLKEETSKVDLNKVILFYKELGANKSYYT